MNQVPALCERDYLRAWVPFFVCTTIGGGVVGAIAGAIVGAFLGAGGVPVGSRAFLLASGAAGLIASLPVHYFFFRLFVSQLWLRKRLDHSDGMS